MSLDNIYFFFFIALAHILLDTDLNNLKNLYSLKMYQRTLHIHI